MSQTRAAMQIFLPIAEVSVNALTLIGLGTIVGLMSGLFGVGGGFLITPLLFLIGIPPAIAVAIGANQVVASSFSGVLAHLRRKSVDIPMGLVLLVGGIAGSALGVLVFNLLQRLGQVDLVVQLCHVVFLGIIMVPAMIYRLGMPTTVVIGTSLFQIAAVSAFTTLMHAIGSNTVDIMLAVLLIVGKVVGAQIGTRLGARLRAEQLRVLLALLVLAVCGKLALDLVLPPADLFSIAPGKS